MTANPQLSYRPHRRHWPHIANDSANGSRDINLNDALLDLEGRKEIPGVKRITGEEVFFAPHLNMMRPVKNAFANLRGVGGGKVACYQVMRHLSPLDFLAAIIGDKRRFIIPVYQDVLREHHAVFAPLQVVRILEDESWRNGHLLAAGYANAFPVFTPDDEVGMMYATHQPREDRWQYRISQLGRGCYVHPGLRVFLRNEVKGLKLPGY